MFENLVWSQLMGPPEIALDRNAPDLRKAEPNPSYSGFSGVYLKKKFPLVEGLF